MKVKPEHLEHMRKCISLVNKKLPEHSYTRYVWDIARAAGLIPFICSELYPYADDTHITTALRSIVRDVEAHRDEQTDYVP